MGAHLLLLPHEALLGAADGLPDSISRAFDRPLGSVAPNVAPSSASRSRREPGMRVAPADTFGLLPMPRRAATPPSTVAVSACFGLAASCSGS